MFSLSIVNKVLGPKIVPENSKVRIKKLVEASKNEKRKVILVYYIGGVTYAEISCFRLLSGILGVQFIVATTQFINGNKLIDSCKNEKGLGLDPATLIS